jgi:hypothetical protein
MVAWSDVERLEFCGATESLTKSLRTVKINIHARLLAPPSHPYKVGIDFFISRLSLNRFQRLTVNRFQLDVVGWRSAADEQHNTHGNS